MTIKDLKKAYRYIGKKRYPKVKDASITDNTDPMTYVFKFGRYQGCKLSEIPASYLQWVIKTVVTRPDVICVVKKFLAIHNPFFAFAQTISDVYAKSVEIDVTQLTKEEILLYRHWMDTVRKMQAVIDEDAGKGSSLAQEALRALEASLPRSIRSGKRSAPPCGLLCIPAGCVACPLCPRSGQEPSSLTTIQKAGNFPPFQNSGVSLSETLGSIFPRKRFKPRSVNWAA